MENWCAVLRAKLEDEHFQGDEGDITVDMAMKNPEKFVLKPQREGGGNGSLCTSQQHILVQLHKFQEVR